VKEQAKIIRVINEGYISAKEMYSPDCEIGFLIKDLWRSERKMFVFEDLATFKNYGYEIHYTGKKSKRLEILKAVHDGEIKK